MRQIVGHGNAVKLWDMGMREMVGKYECCQIMGHGNEVPLRDGN